MLHVLKCYPEYFEAVKKGTKSFECRYNDKNFKVGDELVLREYDSKQGYTGQCIVRTITYILSDFVGLQEGYVILSFKSRKEDITVGDFSNFLALALSGKHDMIVKQTETMIDETGENNG